MSSKHHHRNRDFYSFALKVLQHVNDWKQHDWRFSHVLIPYPHDAQSDYDSRMITLPLLLIAKEGLYNMSQNQRRSYQLYQVNYRLSSKVKYLHLVNQQKEYLLKNRHLLTLLTPSALSAALHISSALSHSSRTLLEEWQQVLPDEGLRPDHRPCYPLHLLLSTGSYQLSLHRILRSP